MTKSILMALAAGIASGLIFLAPASGSMLGLLLANFTHLPLFLAGLGLGAVGVTIAALAGAAVTTALADLTGVTPYVLGFALPAVIIARQALLSRAAPDGTVAWYPVGRLLAIATGYAAALLVIVAVMLGGQAGGLEGTVRTALGEVLSIYVPTLGEAERTAAASLWAETFPAMVAGSWLLTLTVNGGLAQAILARSGRGLRPTPRYAEIEAPNWVMGAIAVSALVWLVAGGATGYVARSLTLVFAIPLFFQGLGVAHVVTRGWPARPFVLTVFYTLILFLPRWSGLAMATGVGLIESLIGLRRRFAAPAADEEED